jgi:hypothetical protein
MATILGDRFEYQRVELGETLPVPVIAALRESCRAFADREAQRDGGSAPRANSHALVASIVERLREAVTQLETLFPGRPFTLDGHLVGSIGEVLAAERYGLELLPPSTLTHDARALDGRLVQVKLTQGDSIGFSSESEHLLVLRLQRDGGLEEIYNGPGRLAWEAAGERQKNGQKPISLSKLKKLMVGVLPTQRLQPTMPPSTSPREEDGGSA